MSQNLPPVDEARLAAEWEADREVLANLKRAGVPVTSRKEGTERIYRTA